MKLKLLLFSITITYFSGLYAQNTQNQPQRISPGVESNTDNAKSGTPVNSSKETTGNSESQNKTDTASKDAAQQDTTENSVSGESSTENPEEKPVTRQRASLFDTVARGGVMMIPIILLGLVGFTLVLERGIFHFKNKTWHTQQLETLLNETAGSSAIKYSEEMEKKLREVTDIHIDRLEKGMGLIHGIGNLEPLLGFLGTVVGMINAFGAIAAAKTVNAKIVASGIQIALVTTAGGLVMAVPILAAFYLYSHISENHIRAANKVIADICGRLPGFLNEK